MRALPDSVPHYITPHPSPPLPPQLAGEQAKLCEWTEERDSLRLQHDSLARRVSTGLGCEVTAKQCHL